MFVTFYSLRCIKKVNYFEYLRNYFSKRRQKTKLLFSLQAYCAVQNLECVFFISLCVLPPSGG